MNISPVHYETLENVKNVFTIPSGSKLLQAVFVLGELRIYYLSERYSKGLKSYAYELVDTGKAPILSVPKQHWLTFSPDNRNVYHLFIESDEPSTGTRVTSGSTTGTVTVSTRSQPTVISEDDHKGLSFIYLKKDGSTRLVRLSRYVDGVSADGRQYVNGLDAERDNNFRTFYLDQIVEWVRVG